MADDRSGLDPLAVAARLEELARSWRPLSADEARALMTPPAMPEPFEVGVARRLEELRALDALSRHLHRAGRS